MQNKVQILLNHNRLLLKRYSKVQIAYYIYVFFFSLFIVASGIGAFQYSHFNINNDFYNSIILISIYSLSINLFLIEIKHRNVTQIQLNNIVVFSIMSKDIYFLFLRTIWLDVRIISYLCALVIVAVGMVISKHEITVTFFFILFLTIYITMFEFYFIALFVTRKMLPDRLDKYLSSLFPTFYFASVIILSWVAPVNIQFLNLPIKYITAIVSNNISSAIAYLCILILFFIGGYYLGVRLSKIMI